MRYITKNKTPEAFDKWLEKHQSTLELLYKDTQISGDVVWKYMNNHREIYQKRTLKIALLQEQGYICCYCGRKIYDDHTTSIEHLKPKSKNKHLTYDYSNLLASCSGGTVYFIHQVKVDETLLSIAKMYNVSEEYLEEVWVNDAFLKRYGKEADIENLQVGDRVIIISKFDKKEQHCDPKKGNNTIHITPLQIDCNKHFIFEKDTGKIVETDQNRETIEVLGLNDNSFLNLLRKDRIEAAMRLRTLFVDKFRHDKTQLLTNLKKVINNLNTGKEGHLQPFVFVTTSILEGK